MRAAEYTWHDAQLRSPLRRLLNAAGAGLSRLGLDRTALTCESVIESAVSAVGSDDFGSDSYHEPLDVFLAACQEEADLSSYGQGLISQQLQRALANRLALQRWASEYPAVRSETIQAPWVILGLPGSGAGILSALLSLDPQTRPLLQWEAAHPIPPTSETEADGDPRIGATTREHDSILKLNPSLQAMRPFGATLAEDCARLFLYDLRTLVLALEAHVPSYARWLEQADMTPAYAQHRLALQALQSRRRGYRWLLRAPNHLWHLEALLAAYPDARIIWTHRDPGPVITALASQANARQRPQSRRRDARPAAAEWRRTCGFGLRSAMGYDVRAKPGWCRHAHYDALIADPVGIVKDLYQSFGDQVTELHVARMQDAMPDRLRETPGGHRFNPADFGWSYAALNEELTDYIARYDVRPEATVRWLCPV